MEPDQNNEKILSEGYKFSFWDEFSFNFISIIDYFTNKNYIEKSRIDNVSRRWKISKRDAFELCIVFDLAQS